MGLLERLDVGDSRLYSSNHFSGDYNQELHIKKAISNDNENSKYYINVYSHINGEVVRQGYIYFYLDKENKTSEFIGIGVAPEYRDLNIGSFLIASWIDLCLNNGYDFLGANKKQRKPFLLYLLKTYGFEIFDKSMYKYRDDVITICRSCDNEDKSKILLFKDLKHEKSFISTNVCKTDNYVIAHDKKGIITLDDVIVPLQNMSKEQIQYWLLNYDLCKDKTLKVMERHKR